MTTVLYIRHGEVPGNDATDPATYTYTGCGTNDSLTKKGEQQAALCAEKIARLVSNGTVAPVKAIYASDLKRAVETATPIAKKLSLVVEKRPSLREISWGDADGKLVAKMEEQYGNFEKLTYRQHPDRETRWNHLPVFPGAESYNALLKRSQEALSRLALKHSGQTLIVVGHGRVLKTLISHSLNSEKGIPYPNNCGIAKFNYSEQTGLRFVSVIEDHDLRSKL